MADEANIRWYVIGILISVITPTVVHIWNSCCGSIWFGLHSWLFQLVAEKFGVCEHRFEGVSNIAAITRVVKALGLRTYRFRWQHDANADTNDSYQVGTVRLPTRSWCLWLLALLGITHYIWVKDDGSSIVMTAPEVSVTALLKVSNLAANRQPTEAELDELRVLIGFGASDVATDRCVVCERLTFGLFTLGCLLVLEDRYFPYGRLLPIACGCLGACGFALMVHLLLRRGAGGVWVRLLCRSVSEFYHNGVNNTIDSAQNLELPLYTAEVNDVQNEEIHSGAFNPDAEADTLFVQSAERRYSLVVGRNAWYEVHCQYSMEPGFAADLSRIRVSSEPILVAIHQSHALSKIVAHRVSVGDDLLYVCVHNPMTDLHIIELKELLTKADKGITLVVVLPAVEYFDHALSNPMTNRLHAHKQSRYVATHADFSAWLSEISMGVFPKILLILPYHDVSAVETSILWRIARDTMKSELM